MGIEVKQLTINSTLQREGTITDTSAGSSDDETSDSASSASSSASTNASTSACFDPDAYKAELLNECTRLIKAASSDRFAR